MKRLLIAALLLPLTALADFEGRVVSVTDGDTIKVLTSDNVEHKVRLLCIDAPERKQAFGNASRENLADKIAGKTVFVEESKRDRYGRILGLVFYPGNVSYEMIADGYAWDYVKYTCGDDYATAQRTAQKNKRGLWQDSYPVPPWEYRRR